MIGSDAAGGGAGSGGPVQVECVHEGICHLGEGPLWRPELQKLFWTDIVGRTLWVHDPASGVSRPFWQGELQVGGFAFTARGSLVLCTDRGVFLLEVSAEGNPIESPRLIASVPLAEAERFNDITTDPLGRVFAGTLDRGQPSGTLYRLERGAAPAALLQGVRCSNGMAFSMDERRFFHTDTLAYRITRYDYDRDTGAIGNPAVHYQGRERDGLPDGITIDVEDHLWVAFWGAGVVRRLDPGGRVTAEVPIPARQPSSLIFGGKQLDELYVTSAAQGAADLATGCDADGTFLGGPVYRFSAAVPGRAEWPADF